MIIAAFFAGLAIGGIGGLFLAGLCTCARLTDYEDALFDLQRENDDLRQAVAS